MKKTPEPEYGENNLKARICFGKKNSNVLRKL